MHFIKVFEHRLFSLFRTYASSLINSTKTLATDTTPLNITENSIIISQSHDIFENLALEDWVYSNYDMTLKNVSILLLWYNSPSVVIGRHQNPWVECNVNFCEENRINIVRRNSGGGTVYHDFGNLNLSFVTSKKAYNRKKNLELICDSIRKRWSVDLKVTARDDIVYKDIYKECVESKATSSVRSHVINLNSICREIDTIGVIKAVSENFKLFYEIDETNVLCLHPCEQLCPGFDDIKEKLRSWSWRFGKTPLFTITKFFPLPLTISPQSSNLEIVMKVDKGIIQSIRISPPVLEVKDFDFLCKGIQSNYFSNEVAVCLDNWIESAQDQVLCRYVKNCILKMIEDVYC